MMNRPTNFWLFGISLILLGISIFLNISQTVITNESVVLTFIGILATFIVVGNYTQVTDIRNNTNKQITDLETKTQKKIDELDLLILNFNKTSEKIEKLELETYYNSAESYRLYGALNIDKKEYKIAVRQLINSARYYLKAEIVPEKLNKVLDNIIINLQPIYWNLNQNLSDSEYGVLLEAVKNFPDIYTQKQQIIDLLEKYREEQIKYKEEQMKKARELMKSMKAHSKDE
jgi:hypothetical protein